MQAYGPILLCLAADSRGCIVADTVRKRQAIFIIAWLRQENEISLPKPEIMKTERLNVGVRAFIATQKQEHDLF